MKPFRIRTLKVRLVISIFVVITSVYALAAMLLLLAYHGDLLSSHALFHGGRIGIFLTIVVFFFISVLTGIMVFYRFNQLFLKPLNALSDAMKKVEMGHYDERVSTDVHIRELNRLMRGFNRMTKEISSVEMLKKDFISYFSHEFKTPMTSIRGFSRQIKEQQLTEEKQKEYIDIIYRESNRLIKMSANVLMLTKLEHQSTLSDVKEFSLDEQLRQSLLLLEDGWSEKNLDLDIDLDPVVIKSNEEIVTQIWVNILGNAIRYSAEGGKLKISCRKEGAFAKIRIKDEGQGMPDEVRERIFEKFYQGDASHGASGNGLGMAIVKRIVDLCQGKIVIKSQINKGTVVIVYLPLNVGSEENV